MAVLDDQELAEVMAGSGDVVAKVELFHFAAPLPKPFHPAWIPGFPQTENRCTLIRVTTAAGVEGWSAGPAIGRERAGLGELIGPYLIGEDATDLALVQQRLREIGYLGWRNWWIEPAFWDLKGKLAGKPVWALLGGDPPDEVAVYASTGEVRGPEERIHESEERHADGFRAIKLRVHADEEADVAQVARTAGAVGERMVIGVDANQGWRVTAIADAPCWNLARARRFADVCAEVGVAWLEEPLAMDAYDDLAALTASSRVPIAGGELHTAGYPELATMVERRCYDTFQPDAVFTGGIAQTYRVIRAVSDAGLRYTPHTWTNGVGMAVNLQLFAASPFAGEGHLEYPLDPPGWVPEVRDAMLAAPFTARTGRLAVPTGPGLGIEISNKALRRHAERFFVMDRKRLMLFGLRERGLRNSLKINKARRARQREKT